MMFDARTACSHSISNYTLNSNCFNEDSSSLRMTSPWLKLLWLPFLPQQRVVYFNVDLGVNKLEILVLLGTA